MMYEEFKKEREVGASAIKWHLKNLEREGKVSKVKKRRIH